MSAIIISGAVFGVVSIFELPMPTTLMDWVVSDMLLGAILYLVYLASAGFNSSNSKMYNNYKKVTA